MQRNREFVEMREIAQLRPFAKNARTHSKEQIEQLAAAIQEFGFTAPILVSPDGEIRAGHGRLEAARSLGMTEVPTLVVGADWSLAKVRAYVIADNKLALNAGWDDEMLRLELAALRIEDFDLGLTGFVEDELAALFDETPERVASTGQLDNPKYSIVIQCDDEANQAELLAEFEERGIECRALML
jgi:ParB-like chromosome segregation protein Spo0J